jgi:nucleoside 2-deoxyribosyltransferase
MMSMSQISVYLAGPEVFLRNAKDIGEQKKALCKKYGFEGIFPIDVQLDLKDKNPREIGFYISTINESLIKSCDIIIANITPFRGPSADVGTVFEMGFAHALGKQVIAYTNVAMPSTQRTVQILGEEVNRGWDGKLRDEQGMFIEENGLIDNLMIDGCINANSKVLVIQEAPKDQLFTYLGGFEKCLKTAKEKKRARGEAP